MKKLIIAAAVATAATINTGAQASATISSNVTDIQLYFWTFNPEVPCAAPYVTGLNITGANPNIINMTGHVCINVSLPIALTFNLTGTYTASGSVFDSGSIAIDMDTGSGWFYYDAVIASPTTPINCLANQPGHLNTCSASVHTTSGLLVPPTGVTSPLPGLWSWSGWPVGSPGINNAICAMDFFGVRASLFLQGTISN